MSRTVQNGSDWNLSSAFSLSGIGIDPSTIQWPTLLTVRSEDIIEIVRLHAVNTMLVSVISSLLWDFENKARKNEPFLHVLILQDILGHREELCAEEDASILRRRWLNDTIRHLRSTVRPNIADWARKSNAVSILFGLADATGAEQVVAPRENAGG